MVLSPLHISIIAASMSLYTDLFAVCGGGDKEVRPFQGWLACRQAYYALQPLGWIGLRSRTIANKRVSPEFFEKHTIYGKDCCAAHSETQQNKNNLNKQK